MEVRTVPCEGPKERGSSPSGGKEPLLSLLLSLFLLLSSLSPALSEEWYPLEEWEVGGEGSAGWRLLEGWEGGARTLGAPQLLSPSPSSFLRDNTPTLDWSDVEGATSYQLLVDNDPSFASPEINVFPSSSEYTVPDPGLSDGTWYWKVRARDGPLTSPWSEARGFTVDTVPPPAPSPLSPENGENLEVDQPLFSWSGVWDPSGVSYRLEIDNDPDLSSPLYREEGIAENSHVPENKLVENFSPYYWRVTAVDGAGNENSSGIFLFRLRVPPSSRISTVVSPYWQTSSPLTLTVEAQDNDGTVENVELWYRFSSDNSSWGPWIFHDNLTSLPYTFYFAFPEQGHYQFSSGVWDDRGNYKAPSVKEAEAGYDNTPPAIPLPSLPENGAVVQTPTPTLAWSGVEDVSGVTYELWLDNDDSDPPLYHLLTGENVHTLENCLGSGTYLWRVRALDGAGWVGEWSENYTFTVRLWGELESWQAGGAPPARWSPLEGWEGTVVAPHVWVPLEGWSASPAAPPGGWRGLEGYSVSLSSLPSFWFPLQGYAAGLSSPASWRQAEALSSTTQALASWREGEGWTVGLAVPSSLWRMAEGWQAEISSLPSFWSPCDSWISSPRAPVPAPRLLSPGEGENTNDNTPTFSWENLQPADNFELQVDNDVDFSSPEIWVTVTSTSYTPTSGLPDNLYCWRVRQWRTGVSSAWSQVWRFRVDTLRPTAPNLLWPANGENINDNTPLFRWCSVPENSLPVTYWIQIDNEPTLSEPYLFSFGWVGENQLQLPPENALPDGVYYWRVRSKDNAGNLSLTWSQIWSFRVDTVRPSVPVPQSPIGGAWAPITPTLSWQAVQENSLPVLYRVWVCESSSFDSELYNVYESAWVQENSWMAPELLEALGMEGKVFYWRVCARDNAGNLGENCQSQWFRVDNVAPSQVQLLYPENGSCVQEGSVTLRWYSATDGGSGVAGYWIQVYSGPSLLCENFVTENQHTLSLGAGEFLWRVRALDAVGNAGPWSENRFFRTAGWRSLEAWTWTAGSPPGWRELEALTVSAASRALWATLESWTGTLSSPSSWHLLEGWAGNLAPASWSLLEGWSGGLGTVEVGWWMLEARSSAAASPALWAPLDSWFHLLPAPGEWGVLEGGTFTSGAPVPAPLPLLPENALNTSDSTPTLTWENLQPADNFELQVDNDPGFSGPEVQVSVVENSYTPTTPLPDNLYRWRVRAWRSGVSSSWSEVRTFRVDTLPPARPSPLSPAAGENVGDCTPVLRWQAPPENSYPLRYYVEVSPDKVNIAESRWVEGENVELSFKEDGIWWWRVLAVDNAGNQGPFTEWRKFRVDTLPPSSPPLLSPENDRWVQTSPVLSWGAVEENSLPLTYQLVILYYPSLMVRENLWTGSTSFTTLLDEGRYLWRVRVRDNAGNLGPWSEERLFGVDNTPPSPAQPLRPENGSFLNLGPVQLSWLASTDSPSGVRGYHLQVGENQDLSSLLYENENVGDNGYTWVPPGPGIYSWRVRALDLAGNASEWSGIRWFRACRWERLEGWSWEGRAPSGWLEMEGWVEGLSSPSGWRGLEGWGGGTEAPFAGWSRLEGWAGGVEALTGRWVELEGWREFLPSVVVAPTLLYPENGRNLRENAPTLSWENVFLADNYRLQLSSQAPVWAGENAYVGQEPLTLSDGSPRRGEVVGGSLEDTRAEDGACENLAENEEDNTLNWEHRIENVPQAQTYVLRVRGYTSGDENVGVYLREMGAWRLLGWLEESEVTLEFSFGFRELGKYLVENRLAVRYLENTPDSTRTVLHLDLCVLEALSQEFPSTLVDNVLENHYTPSPLPDNLYYWRVRAHVSGLTGEWSEIWSFRVDTVPPGAPTLLSPSDGENENTPTPLLQWLSPSENSLPLAFFVQVALDHLFTQPVENSGWIQQNYWVPSPLQENVYYWRVFARDNAGNEGTLPSPTWSFRVDLTPPPVPVLLSPAAGENLNTRTPLLRWENVWDISGPLSYNLRVEYGPVTVHDVTLSENAWQVPPLSVDGIYSWRVRARDGAGNWSSFSPSRTFQLDTAPPPAPSPLSPENGENLREVEFRWTSVAENSLPVRYRVKLSDDPSFSHENAVSGWVEGENWRMDLPLPDGVWYWRVQARDNAGNEGENSEIRWFRLDNLPPQGVDLLWPDNGATLENSQPTLSWAEGTDNSLPLSYRVLVSVGEVENYLDSGWISENSWQVPFPLPDNDYQWRVRARDNASNVYETPVRWFRVENAPPPAPVPLSPENGKVVGIPSPLLVWRTSPDISQPVLHRVWVSRDENFESVVADSGWLDNDRWEVSPPLEDNLTYYWRVQARDNSGKESENSVTFRFFTDLHAPPEVELLSPENGAELETFTLLFKWGSVEDNTRVLYELAVDNESGMTEPFLHAENTPENSRIVGFASPGTYYWRVRAVDEAGHENSSPVWSFTLRRWRHLEGWSGGVSGPQERGWVVLDGRSGSSFTSASWVRLEERKAAVAGGVGWRVLEERRATAGHFSSWRALEGRSFSMRAPALRGWVQLENRGGGVVAPHGWRELEGMEVGALTSAGWKKVVVGGPALLPEWGPLEGWRAGVSGWAPPPSREVSLGYLEPGVPGSAEVGWLGICVSRLEVVVREEGRVTVSAWESEDFPVPPPPEVVPYRYFCLELGPSSPALSHAVVRVRVSRSWVREERIDVRTIGVRRLPSQELALEEVGRDGQYLYFQFRTEELGTFLLFGQRVRQPPSPPVALLPTFEVPAAPSSLLLLLLFLGMILAAAGFSLYQASWSFRYGRMVGLLRRATRPERRRAVRERVRLTRRQRESLARMSLLLRRAALPPVVPVRRRLAKPERVAVEALERFIRERRRAAGLAPEEVERLRRRARKELASWRTLQRVVERKRREVLRRRRVRGSSGARRGRRRAS